MFTPSTTKTDLEKSIDTALLRADAYDPSTEEFARSVDQISKLHKMKEAERPSSLSQDTLVLCLTNIAGIIMIIKHEQFNVITSKALGFVVKPKA